MQYAIPEMRSASGRWGNFILSRSSHVVQKKARNPLPQRLPHQVPIPQQHIEHALRDNRDVVLAVEHPYLPHEIGWLLSEIGLLADFVTYCKGVVFCSYLVEERDPNQWTRGFVIEREEEASASSPYRFTRREVAALTDGFLSSPYEAIFVRSYLPGRENLPGLGYLPALVYFLGYLKSTAVLDLNDVNPDAIARGVRSPGYRLKSFYAAQYEFDAAKMLWKWASKSRESQLVEVCSWIAQTWVPLARWRLQQ
ncbi:MAG: hypothetical protein ABIH22_02640 [Candidatus Margulisiibacteriota bacterium]